MYKKSDPPLQAPVFPIQRANMDTLSVYTRIAEKHGDPLEALANIAFDEMLDTQTRLSALKDLVKYGHAQRKFVEISGPDGGPVELRVDVMESMMEILKNNARSKRPKT